MPRGPSVSGLFLCFEEPLLPSVFHAILSLMSDQSYFVVKVKREKGVEVTKKKIRFENVFLNSSSIPEDFATKIEKQNKKPCSQSQLPREAIGPELCPL